MNKYICIHGHFYQPPRENPWLEEIEIQDSAFPYHDWNQRISSECYAPNAIARVLDDNGMIVDLVNNYSKMSFNFGPTLLSWLKKNDSLTYNTIIKSDEISIKNFSGHGSALAQCYNHIIMPLANNRDKKTQIIWGIRDFESHFKRKPEGMWLPETAVDIETLEIMAEFCIKFTILSPHQAKRIKKIDNNEWMDVSGQKVDPKMVYRCNLPTGKNINIFFYDGPTSHDVSFGGLLNSGVNLANRLMNCFSSDNYDQLVNIATDGETYGHHHRMGDMALAYCLEHIDKNNNAIITNYANYLKIHPAKYEVEIFQNSSWSCIHGVERWRNDCGCNSGGNYGWTQAWRKPLRDAFDWLRETLIETYKKHAPSYLNDIWDARDYYIDVILNRSKENVNNFFKKYSIKDLSEKEKINALKLLEAQRHAMLMYTSCGWFFDEISGIETVQILQYAARAIQLTNDFNPQDTEKKFITLLEKAPSNISKYGNGAYLYLKEISPKILDFERVGAHYAISSLFKPMEDLNEIYCFETERKVFDFQESGSHRLAVGKAKIHSNVTLEEEIINFAVFHLGQHTLTAGISKLTDDREFLKFHNDVKIAFKDNDALEIIRLIKKNFQSNHYSLKHLFKDEQSKILYQILDVTLEKINYSLQQINEYHYPIIQVVKSLQIPLPKILHNTILVMLNIDIMQVLGEDKIDFYKLEKLVDEIREWNLEVDKVALEFIVRKKINDLMKKFSENSNEISSLNSIELLLKILEPLSLNINLWNAQNIFFFTGKKIYMENKSKENHDIKAKKWIEAIENSSRLLNVNLYNKKNI